jgi:hypothetical protein
MKMRAARVLGGILLTFSATCSQATTIFDERQYVLFNDPHSGWLHHEDVLARPWWQPDIFLSREVAGPVGLPAGSNIGLPLPSGDSHPVSGGPAPTIVNLTESTGNTGQLAEKTAKDLLREHSGWLHREDVLNRPWWQPDIFLEREGAGSVYFPNPTPGTVGLTDVGGIQSEVQVAPGPVVGAGLPGLLAAFGGLLAWMRRRKTKPKSLCS